MLQLIVTLNEKNKLSSLANSSGRWEIYLERSGQRTKIAEKFFSADDKAKELRSAAEELDKLDTSIH